MDELHARLCEAYRLKRLPRAGWLRVGVEAPESVAAHSWGVAYLVLLLCPPDVDRGRALALAVLHDVGEARVGDITPHDGVDRAEKRRAEEAALVSLVDPALVALWREYEDGSSPEGRFVKACDKLDMALQAQLYATEGKDTREFITSALAALDDELLRALAGRGATERSNVGA
jgi:putative hydrolase of HD superfamily